MNRDVSHRAVPAIVLLPLAFLVGCFSSPSSSFYVLQEIPPRAESESAGRELAIGVGPLQIAEYLDRPQMVIRESGNALAIDEFHRWAEPLKDSLPRLLAMNLATLLGTDEVALFPWKGYGPMDYRVEGLVTRFEAGPSEIVTLEVQWTLVEEADPQVASTHRFRTGVPMKDDDPEDQAAAMNEAFSEFSRTVAEAIQAAAARTAE